MTLYRSYRPKTFDDVYGQEHVVRTLKNAILLDRIAHAYLLTGPRGTGKTTLARIFAVAVNCMPREGFIPCSSTTCTRLQNGESLDIIEIDAASNTGVDHIRDLRDSVATPPTEAQYKVYIIDEVHMLSTAAMNALLKTLEEPPTRTIFILATTELHKVKETIVSRCQRFTLSHLSADNITRKLLTIAAAEGRELDPSAAADIATLAEGSMRDAESLLGQVFAWEDGPITTATIQTVLGATATVDAIELVHLLIEKNVSAALALIETVANRGQNIAHLGNRTIAVVRDLLVAVVCGSVVRSVANLTTEQQNILLTLAKKTTTKNVLAILDTLTDRLTRPSLSTFPQLPLESAIVAICEQAQGGITQKTVHATTSSISTTPSTHTKNFSSPEEKEEKTISSEFIKKITTTTTTTLTPATSKKNTSSNDADNDILETIRKNWYDIVNDVAKDLPSLQKILISQKPKDYQNGILTIVAPHTIAKEQIEQKLALTLTQKIATIRSEVVKIIVVVNTQPQQEDLLASAISIMGGGEIVS